MLMHKKTHMSRYIIEETRIALLRVCMKFDNTLQNSTQTPAPTLPDPTCEIDLN